MQQPQTPAQEFPLVVKDWTIKRSGASMTITGKNAAGQPTRVAGVYSVSPATMGASRAWSKDAAGKVIATLI